MAPPLDIPTRQKHAAYDPNPIPQIQFSEASSGESGSLGSDYSNASTSNSVDVPEAILFTFTVIFGKKTDNDQMTIDASLPGLYCDLETQLKELRDRIGVCGDVNSDRSATLCVDNHPSDQWPLSCEEQLEDILGEYRRTAGYTRIEICETIECQDVVCGSTQRQRVRDILASKRKCSVYNNCQFIPESDLKDVLTKDVIEQLFYEDTYLRELGTSHLQELVDRIDEKGRKLLAAILFANIDSFGTLIHNFKKNGLLDRYMPFKHEKCPSFCQSTSSRLDYESICKNQWQVVPLNLRPYEDGKPNKNMYPRDRILPFLYMERLNSGGFGDVFKVRVHPEYQHIPNSKSDSWLALKKFRGNTDKSMADFEREVKALVHISGNANPHLMQLVTAFQHGDDYLLFFPLAHCSLRAYFLNDSHLKDRRHFRWMIGQIFGLAQGIRAIHGDAKTLTPAHLSVRPTAIQSGDVIGYHHDLKPDNILLQMYEGNQIELSELEKAFGRLLISDFGLGRFREAATGSVSMNIKGTPTYAPPEAKNGQSRAYDIWSFGCIILEAMIWLLKGSQGVQSFQQSRDTAKSSNDDNVTVDYYWVEREQGFKINPAVKDHIEGIRNQNVYPEYYKQINDIMDVVLQCLQVDNRKRPTAKPLCEQIGKIFDGL